jgi:hypothetical protein
LGNQTANIGGILDFSANTQRFYQKQRQSQCNPIAKLVPIPPRRFIAETAAIMVRINAETGTLYFYTTPPNTHL